MIINRVENIVQYGSMFRYFSEAKANLEAMNFSTLQEGKNEISENCYIVKIVGDKKSDFEGVLEVHKEWIDIHIPLTDDEIIAFKELNECKQVEKEYDSENDYMLYRESDIAQMVLPKGYACIIDTTMCHMAMLGEGKLEKLVFKIRK